MPTISLATAVPAYAATSPTYCAPVGTLFDAHARARLLSGSLLGINLDNVVELAGVHSSTPGATQVDQDSSPLSVTALNALTVNLGGLSGALSQFLTLVAPAGVGTLNQFSKAHEGFGNAPTTEEVGAAGAVNQASGALTLNPNSPNPPELGSLDLRAILQNIAGNNAVTALLSQVADLKLQIGAVAGRAWMDSGCTTPEVANLDRDYLVAYLRLLVQSAVVGNLLSALTTALGNLTISTAAVWNLLSAIPALGPIIALGQSNLQVTVTVNTALLTAQPIPNVAGSALQLNLANGSLVLDLAAILGSAYPGTPSEFLNSRPENTRLFVDAPLPTNAVADLLDQWVDDLVERLQDLVTIRVQIGSVSGIGATGLLIQGSLRQFLNGTATTTIVALGIPVNLGALLGPLLGDIGGLVVTAIKSLFSTAGPVQTAFTALNGLLDVIFTVLQNVIVLRLNAQNRPSNALPVPDDLQALEIGRYDVAALHVGLVDSLVGLPLDLLDLFLARGSVGDNEPK